MPFRSILSVIGRNSFKINYVNCQLVSAMKNPKFNIFIFNLLKLKNRKHIYIKAAHFFFSFRF